MITNKAVYFNYRLNATEVIFDTSEIQFIPGQRGSKLLSFGGYTFVKNRATEGIMNSVQTYGIIHKWRQ